MSGTTKAQDVIDLLKTVSAVKETAKVLTEGPITPERTLSDVDKYLYSPWEPDFVDGYEITNAGGTVITLDEVWEAYVDGEIVAFVGPTGSGKSTIAYHLLDKANAAIRTHNAKVHKDNLAILSKGGKMSDLYPYKELPYQVSHQACNNQTRVEELIGSLDLQINASGQRVPVEVLGSLSDAFKNGKTLIFEEADTLLPGIAAVTHVFFDRRSDVTTIHINGPKQIKRNSRFRVFFTMNTMMRGENQIEHAGTELQNSALRNRITFWAYIDYMKPAAEKELLARSKKVADVRVDAINRMVEVANRTRVEKKSGRGDEAISTRQLLSWVREMARRGRRMGVSSSMTLDNYWEKVAIPAAGPTILASIIDPNTRTAYEQFLTIIK